MTAPGDYDLDLGAVSSIAQRVRDQLHEHRVGGGDEDVFLADLVDQFVSSASRQHGPAALVRMAMAMYALAHASDEIARLTDALAMRDELLALLPE